MQALRIYFGGGVVLAALVVPVAAQTVLPTIDVVAASPTAGSETSRDRLPGSSSSVDAAAIARSPQPDAVRALEQRVPSVTINDNTGNTFQPEVEFRGFVASPVPGTQQGIAVYQNGVRINEPFGDAVNWDFIPSNAIDQASIVSNNPAFGLNALGGALTLRMKDGFTWQGLETDLRIGSFGRRQASLQYGKTIGAWSTYVAMEAIHDGGWRQRATSEIRRAFADIGYRGDSAEIHLDLNAASNRFGAAATTPANLLASNWGSVYTVPQTSRNELAAANLRGKWDVTQTLQVSGNLYLRSTRQTHVDGNTADTESCTSNASRPFFGNVCLQNDPFPSGLGKDQFVLRDAAGNPIAASVLRGGLAGSIDRTSTSALAWGGSLQATSSEEISGHRNRLIGGLALDFSHVDFSAGSELGIVQPNLSVLGTGIDYHTLVPGGVTPVGLAVRNAYAGVYLLDTFDITDRWTITAGGRFNQAQITLRDKLGTALNGASTYARFNPLAGTTFKLSEAWSAYAGYSEANRAPTPLELGCADRASPCLIDNFLSSDPPLKQVVSRTVEAGLRGQSDAWGGKLSWSGGLFSTRNENDIVSAPSAIAGRGYFTNAGQTQRRGIEAEAQFRQETWSAYATYALVDATFRSALTLPSPNNPFADANGNIQVQPGDTLAGVPRHRFKAGAEWTGWPKLTLGADLLMTSGVYLRGDESNQFGKLPGDAVVNAHAAYKLSDSLEVYGLVNNLLDRRYSTAGSFFDMTAIPSMGFTDPRSLAPAAPRAFYAGLKARF